jgi:hypothetical protein
MHVAFAVAMVPVTVGRPAVYVFASDHLISYWWLAFALGWVIVLLAVLVRALRYARRAQEGGRQAKRIMTRPRLPT